MLERTVRSWKAENELEKKKVKLETTEVRKSMEFLNIVIGIQN